MDGLAVLLLAIGAGLLGFVARGFTTSYVAEKGKNAATKEDIEEITSKVEAIKAELHEQLSFRQSRRGQQAEALLGFHDAAVELIHEHYSVSFGDFPFDKGESLYAFQESFHQSTGRLVKAYRRLSVFLDENRELLGPAEEVVVASVKAQEVFREKFPLLKHRLMEESRAYSTTGGGISGVYSAAAEKADAANALFWRSMKPHTSAFGSSFNEFVRRLSAFVSAPG